MEEVRGRASFSRVFAMAGVACLLCTCVVTFLGVTGRPLSATVMYSQAASPLATSALQQPSGSMSTRDAYARFMQAQANFIEKRSKEWRKLITDDCTLVFQTGTGDNLYFNTSAGVVMWMEAIGDYSRPFWDKMESWLMDIDEVSRVAQEGAYFHGFGLGTDTYYFNAEGLMRKLLFRFDKCEAEPPICPSKPQGSGVKDWL